MMVKFSIAHENRNKFDILRTDKFDFLNFISQKACNCILYNYILYQQI